MKNDLEYITKKLKFIKSKYNIISQDVNNEDE